MRKPKWRHRLYIRARSVALSNTEAGVPYENGWFLHGPIVQGQGRRERPNSHREKTAVVSFPGGKLDLTDTGSSEHDSEIISEQSVEEEVESTAVIQLDLGLGVEPALFRITLFGFLEIDFSGLSSREKTKAIRMLLRFYQKMPEDAEA